MLFLGVVLICGLIKSTFSSALPHFKRDGHHSEVTSSKPSKFNSVITLGASYCDNGHARDDKFKASLARGPYNSGRHSNGQIWAEYLANTLQSRLYDYAYSGATSDDSHNVPDTAEQIESYRSDCKDGKINEGPVLHLIWIGINSVYRTWQEGRGEDEIDSKVEKVEQQMRLLVKDSIINSDGAKFVVLTLPPLELVPNSAEIASQSTNPFKALERIKSLTQRYNQGLMRMQSNAIHVLDIVPFWCKVKNNPGDYGFSCTTRACLGDRDMICKDPETFMYWDSLHPTTKMHELIAGRVQEFVENLQE